MVLWQIVVPSIMFVCLCRAEVVMRSHLNGRKHQSLIKFKELQQSQADRSAFVCGFPFGTTEIQLKNMFTVYGNILKVVVSKEQVCSLFNFVFIN